MPTLDELALALKAADAAGNSDDAAKLARAYQAAKEELSRQGKREAASQQKSQHERLEQFRSELADWDKVKDSKDPKEFFAYLDKYPSGFMSEQAQFRLDRFAGPGIEPVPGRDYPKPLPSGARRYEVGDELVYDSIDTLTGITRRLPTITVSFADDDRVEFKPNPLVLDQMGGIVRDSAGGVKTPPYMIAPADLAIGKRWRTAFHDVHADGWEGDVTWDYRVEAFEPVTVPAGTIRAFRVKADGFAIWASSRGSSILREMAWIDPTVMRRVRIVRDELISTFIYGASDKNQWELRLVSLKLAPRNPKPAKN